MDLDGGALLPDLYLADGGVDYPARTHDVVGQFHLADAVRLPEADLEHHHPEGVRELVVVGYFADGVLGPFLRFRNVPLLDLHAGPQFELADQVFLLGGDERYGRPFPACTPGPADPVDIGVDVVRHIVVDDIRYVVDVQSPGGDVGGDQQVGLAFLEVVHDPLPLLLGHVSVEGLHLVVVLLQPLFQDVDHLDGLTEYQGLGFVYVEDPGECPGFVPPSDGDVVFLDEVEDDLVLGDVDLLGLFHVIGGQPLYVLRHGGGEHEHLPVGRALFEYEFYVVDETHVEHAVRLVHDDHLYPGQVQIFPLDHVLDAAGGTRYDVHALLQLVDLPLYARPSVDGDAYVSAEVGHLSEFLGDLDGQLPGGFEDDGGRDLLSAGYGAEYHRAEGSGLPGTGLCLGYEVVSLQSGGDRRLLYGRRFFPAHLVYRFCHVLGYAEIQELRDHFPSRDLTLQPATYPQTTVIFGHPYRRSSYIRMPREKSLSVSGTVFFVPSSRE